MPRRTDTCEYCAAELPIAERPVTVHRHQRAQHFIFERVPARVCQQCGERYFSAAVTRRMQEQMRKPGVKADLIEVPVISFA